MIEVTDEMKAAFRAAQEARAAELVAEGAPLGAHDILDRGLVAVLAIIERDYRMKLRRTPSWRDAPGCMCARTGRPYRLCPVHGEVVS